MKKGKQAHTSSNKGGPFKGDWHVSNTSMGMGDYYGQAIRQKIGIPRDSYTPMSPPITKKQMKTPPTTLA